MFGQLLGHFVALQHVLEGVDAEAEILGHPHEQEDLVGAIGVCVDSDVALHDVDERLQPEITARHQAANPLVLLPLAPVVLRLGKPPAECVFDPHTRLGEATVRVGSVRAGARHVLT